MTKRTKRIAIGAAIGGLAALGIAATANAAVGDTLGPFTVFTSADSDAGQVATRACNRMNADLATFQASPPSDGDGLVTIDYFCAARS